MSNTLQENYRLAVNRFFDYSTGDPTAVLAREHGLIGLTRIITCMKKLGINSSGVSFVALPDFTYTRSKLRWNAGFPYGCIIHFDENETPFIPVDFRPNCCGIVFAQIPEFNQTASSLQHKFYEIMQSYSDIDKNDFNRRNHFMGIYRCADTQKYYFLLHGSFRFAKRALYSEKNEALAAGSQSELIMGEQFLYLWGVQAHDYYNSYLEHERLTFHYRELITKELFPQAQIMFHRTHEGFYGINTILLGAYADNNPFCCPIMLAPECDLPIIEVNSPISIPGKSDFYAAPHGGGYALYGISATRRVDHSLNGDYILSYPNNSEMITNNVLDMPFYYRMHTEEYWCNKYHMAGELMRLKPILNLKV